MRRQILRGATACVAFLWMGSSVAAADCIVDTRRTFGKSIRVIKCDESESVIEEAMTRAAEACGTLDREFATSCYEAVVESFEMRRESMLRRALKEGASVKAAAELYGYTEAEVDQWIADNTPTNRGYTTPGEVPDAVAQAEEDMAAALKMLEQ